MKKFLIVIVLLILTAPAFTRILPTGFWPMQDDMQVFRLVEMDKCFKDGQIPCRWVPDAGYGYGYPLFNFYSPGAYYLGELLHLIGFGFIDSTKLVVILGFIATTLFMYLLSREFFGPASAIASSLLYAYAPYKAQEIYVRGDISEFLASALFPFILWSIYKLTSTGKKQYFFWVTIGLGLIFVMHNLFSFLFLPIVFVWSVFCIIKYRKKINYKRLVFAFAVGLGLASFFILPVLFEKQYVHVETLLGGYFDYRQHFVSIKQLLFSNTWGYGSSELGPNDDLSLSTGILHWIVGFASIIFAAINFKKHKEISILVFVLYAIEIGILFLMHEKSAVIWLTIPALAWLQFPWRFLGISAFILSFLSGFTIFSLSKLKTVVAIGVVLLTFLLYSSFFSPVKWLNITDSDKLSGPLWDKELTASIFDYLPIYAILPPPSAAPESPEILSGMAQFINYTKASNYQSGQLVVSSDAMIRLPWFDFPGMKVYLNNLKVNHNHTNCQGQESCLGLISFNAPIGEYTFRVNFENTLIRTIGNIISVGSVISLLFYLYKNDKAKRN